jgi:redox-sensitive bicupin YhaK (pirin superfamily)
MPVTVEIRRASQGYLTRERGLRTRHAFSFGGHYDPDNTGFGPLVCHDDHLVGSGLGFPDHPHAGVEIVTWVLEGALVHTDSTGASATVTPGTVQVQATGSGIVHSERASEAGPARFVQAWLTPHTGGAGDTGGADGADDAGEPSYETAVVDLTGGRLVAVASGHDPAAAVRLRTSNATFSVARLEGGETLTLPDDPWQHVYVTRGALLRSSLAEPLADGDSFRITDQPGLEITAGVPTEVLVWTFRR